MFTLPSLWNLVISTIVFIVAARYIRNYLDEQGVAKSMTRSVLVFAIAYLLSWGAGEAVDWTQGKTGAVQPVAQSSVELLDDLRRQAQP